MLQGPPPSCQLCLAPYIAIIARCSSRRHQYPLMVRGNPHQPSQIRQCSTFSTGSSQCHHNSDTHQTRALICRTIHSGKERSVGTICASQSAPLKSAMLKSAQHKSAPRSLAHANWRWRVTMRIFAPHKLEPRSICHPSNTAQCEVRSPKSKIRTDSLYCNWRPTSPQVACHEIASNPCVTTKMFKRSSSFRPPFSQYALRLRPVRRHAPLRIPLHAPKRAAFLPLFFLITQSSPVRKSYRLI